MFFFPGALRLKSPLKWQGDQRSSSTHFLIGDGEGEMAGLQEIKYLFLFAYLWFNAS